MSVACPSKSCQQEVLKSVARCCCLWRSKWFSLHFYAVARVFYGGFLAIQVKESLWHFDLGYNKNPFFKAMCHSWP